MFTAWFNGFVYNQIWEDPRIDIQGLKLGPGSRLLTIASGGCNVLNYLTAEPDAIVAVDLNPHHLHLTRLKLVALEHLPGYDEFFGFFGQADREENVENYYRYLREHLDDEARRFWEGGLWLFRKLRGPRIRYFAKNLYDYAKLGYFLRCLHWVSRKTRRDPAVLLEATTIAEQERIFEEGLGSFFETWYVRALGKMPFVLFSLGIPPRQYEFLKEESGGRVAGVLQDRVRKLACGFPIDDNYFAWQAFGRRYDVTGCRALPAYLKRENYDLLRQNVHRVDTEVASFTDFLRRQPDGSFSRFVLLDSQDWMLPTEIEELWSQILRVGTADARVIFRTASSLSPLDEALPRRIRRGFRYEERLSQSLLQEDRSAIYGGFHVYAMDE